MRLFNQEISQLALMCVATLAVAGPAGCSAVATGDAAGGEFGSAGADDDDLGGSSAGDAAEDAGDESGSQGPAYDVGNDEGDEPECDPWTQDCPDGLRCAWVTGTDPMSGYMTGPEPMCVADPLEPLEAGERCQVLDGVDTCAKGMHCAHTDADGIGVCLPLCTGSIDEPVCPGDDHCQVCEDCPSVCAPACSPLDAAACPDGLLCAPTSSSGPFVCTVDASGEDAGLIGDTCEFANECASGHDCVDAAAVPGCAGERCCAPYCELPTNGIQPNGTTNECPSGTTCQPWSQSGALDGLENLGICKAPL